MVKRRNSSKHVNNNLSFLNSFSFITPLGPSHKVKLDQTARIIPYMDRITLPMPQKDMLKFLVLVPRDET